VLFHASLPAASQSPERAVTVPAGPVLKITVDAKPEPAGFVMPVDNDWVAVTNGSGQFALPSLAPGKHTLEAWHALLGTVSQEVTIAANVAAPIEFIFENPTSLTPLSSPSLLELSGGTNRLDGRSSSHCRFATGPGPVFDACQKGGRAGAKKTMKKILADTKTVGRKETCENCHRDIEEYELREGARPRLDDLLRLLAARPTPPR